MRGYALSNIIAFDLFYFCINNQNIEKFRLKYLFFCISIYKITFTMQKKQSCFPFYGFIYKRIMVESYITFFFYLKRIRRKTVQRSAGDKTTMKYPCIEVKEPNLYKDIFPYESIPLAQFGDGVFLPDDIWVTDTTLRDGQQSMRSFTAKQSVEIFEFLHQIDNGSGVIRQAEFFVYSENDREALIRCLELGYDFPEVTTWIRAVDKDFDLIKDLGVKETGMLMSCSDYHIFKKLNLTRSKTIEQYLHVAETSLKAGIRPRCHLEDMTRADYHGFVVPLVKNLKDLCDGYGIPVKIRVCDTLGVGIPFEDSELPRSVPKLIKGMQEECGLESSEIEWHGHNDFHLAVANSMSAWLYGSSSISTTLLGIGERSGNTPLEGMLFQYAQLKGNAKKIRFDLFKQVAEYFSREFDYEVHEKYPLVGADFNTTKAGIHADGLLKNPEIYNSFNTKTILNRSIIIKINQSSGTAGIAGWINGHYHLTGDEKIDKHDIRITQIKNWVDSEYETGRTSNISNKELRIFTEKHFPELAMKEKQDNFTSTEMDLEV